MSYRRFHLTDLDLAPATFATPATHWSVRPQTVANVASVAGVKAGSSASDAQSVATVATVAGPDPWTGTPRMPSERIGRATLATVATVPKPGEAVVSIVEAFRLMLERSPRRTSHGIYVVEHFLDQHDDNARRLGWTDIELFGCHPDPAFALVRYDYMGAVTISALMGKPIATVAEAKITCVNGLVSRRNSAIPPAAPVWQVFADE